jgi:hypothetical protein
VRLHERRRVGGDGLLLALALRRLRVEPGLVDGVGPERGRSAVNLEEQALLCQ